MTKIIEDHIDGSPVWDQYRRAIDAVVERGLDKGELYTSVISDQLLYVAALLMLEHDQQHDDGLLAVWCEDMIALIERRFQELRNFLDKLMEKDGGK